MDKAFFETASSPQDDTLYITVSKSGSVKYEIVIIRTSEGLQLSVHPNDWCDPFERFEVLDSDIPKDDAE